MYDFTHIVDFIFKNKEDYKKLSDEDKDKFFFIINRKFARAYPQHSQFFNKKDINKASAMDLWYYYFIKKRVQGIPSWYWTKKSQVKKESTIKYSANEVDFLINFYDINEDDIKYLIKYHPNEIDEEVKKYRKFNKNGD